ncbi:hypothetical protein CE91St36_06160 [Christensenellaceae bacterium]|nr:hypothetical protein CE91St36_06160 [Christensenellaceae bacterium]BDF60467.1 hypothetical protein CE91St37_06170 [Christensenellaceae bacterium]
MRRRKEKLYSDFNLSQLNKERRTEILRHIDYLTDRLALKLDADGQRLLKELIFYLSLL